MIDERIYEQFRDIGRDMYVDRLISSHGGNLSIRYGDRVIIKRRGAMLGRLKHHDLIDTSLDKNDSGVVLASTELIVHRAIYKATPALAVVHAHPRTAIAFSLSRDEIVPIDNEGSYLLKKVPVVSVEMASGSKQMAEAVASQGSLAPNLHTSGARIGLAQLAVLAARGYLAVARYEKYEKLRVPEVPRYPDAAWKVDVKPAE